MMHAYLYRATGAAWCVVLALNVHKHGWHPMSVAIGPPLAVLLFSLGVAPERRTAWWEARYLVTAVVFVGLAALRFLRF
jgi:hypothetical protein